MAAHTAPLMSDARRPRDRVATASTTRHTAPHGTRNDFANAPIPMATPSTICISSSSAHAAVGVGRAPNTTNIAAPLMSGVVSSGGTIVRPKKANSVYAPASPHGPARMEFRARRHSEYARAYTQMPRTSR